MTMHWNTYLVRLYPDVNHMDAWDERMRRTQLITEGFIRPQAQEMALALDDARNALESLDLNYERDTPTHPNSIIARIEPRIRLMAIMMWDHLDELTRNILSNKPTKEQIMQLRYRCIEMLDGHYDKIDWETDKEIHRTIWALNAVLQQWELNKSYPLRFHPYKPVRFNRYSI